MKGKYTYVWISFIILIFGIICIPKIIAKFEEGIVVNNRLSKSPLAYLEINKEKKKVPAFHLLNQDSLWISETDFENKVFIVAFFFTTCPTICPIMHKNLMYLQTNFKTREDFGIASITINPKYDTPIVLKAYAEKHQIKSLNWNFLTGDADSIYKLANKGFNIFAQSNINAPGGFEHSGYFALVDKKGYLRSRYDTSGNPILFYRGAIDWEKKIGTNGETEQITWLKEDIEKLLKE